MSKRSPAFEYFNKQASLFIKGIAIILMVCHHMWWSKDINDFTGIWYSIAPLLISLGKAGKVCVAIFTFISGYGLYLSLSGNNNYYSILAKIKNVFFHFWITTIPILIILFFTGLIPFNIMEFLKNITCINNSYNGAWWYLQTYIIYLAIYPSILLIMKKKWSAIILCIISMTIFRYISYIFLGKQMPIHYLLYYFPFLILGTTFCKYKLLEKLTYKKTLYHSSYI